MKSPEEWLNTDSPLDRCSCECEVRTEELLIWIKAIQADAIAYTLQRIEENKSHWLM